MKQNYIIIITFSQEKGETFKLKLSGYGSFEGHGPVFIRKPCYGQIRFHTKIMEYLLHYISMSFNDLMIILKQFELSYFLDALCRVLLYCYKYLRKQSIMLKI